ncbi:MAG: MinD/ParA family protein, partial [Thermodesulfobacteriota bacterium]|nr:MinD/ParA family protein [Thermodesulfobacteriota bacterium]
MKDQAHSLRRLVMERDITSPIKVFSVTSGKGGVGKTSIVVNIAIMLASIGKKVLVLDADLGLANVDMILGLIPKYNIRHVLEGECSIEDILLDGPGGIKIIPASSGVQELADLSYEQQISLTNALDYFSQEMDYMLVDTGAGISKNVMYFNMSVQRIILVVTPEPTSITDAYALIKVVRKKYGIKRFNLIINNVLSIIEGEGVAEKLRFACERFLGDVSLDMLGSIPYDKHIPECVRGQKAFVGVYPRSITAQRLKSIAKGLNSISNLVEENGNMQFFLRRMLLEQTGGVNNAGHGV